MAVTLGIITTMATSTSALIITVIIVIVIASVGGVKLSMVTLVLAPIIVLLSPSSLLGSSERPFATLLTCGLCYYLCNSHYDNSCLSLHRVPLLQGEVEVVEAAVEVFICLFLISFLLYILCL